MDKSVKARPSEGDVDVLAAITGSHVRADVLGAIFGGIARSWKPLELQRATGRAHSPIYRELRRLVGAGLLRRGRERVQAYEPELETPIAQQVRRLVLQTRGRVPRIRKALVQIRSRSLAWALGGTLKGTGGAAAIIVLTSAPKSLVRVQLAGLLDASTEVHCMSIGEWVARLEKGDVFARRARRARKLWIMGDWEELARRERIELDSKRLLRTVRRSWREELSDEWDEDWDPFARGRRA